MADHLLKIGLLGYPHATIGTDVVDKFVTKRAESLIYYLAATRRSHSRDKLATLFWPDATEAKGKHNLRTALSVLRKLLGNYLTISRGAVVFDDSQPFILDTLQLETAVSTQNIEELQTAVSAYKGDFLEGFHVDGSPDFDDWVFAQSEQYRNLFIQGLHLLSAYYLQERQYIEGLAITARLLDVEPWSESGYRQRMLLFAYNQQRSSALKTYAQCQQVLDETFGIEPMVETIALYERIRAEGTNGEEAIAPLHNLPRELTPFVGRTAELRQLRDKAVDPLYPLVTIMGEGGVGKSRFARLAASQLLYEFPDGVWFIPLIDIAAADEVEEVETGLALAIGNALDIQMHANSPVTEQVITFLQGKRPLLILDNMEHLINGVDFIVRLLKEAKQAQLIVTSRRRLNLQVESVLRLRGLPTPPEGATQDEAIAHSSVQLFVERASRVEPDFALTAENMNTVGNICRLVDGLPLGIELAAALVEQQRCDAIASAIENSIGTLATAMRDLPDHHRTIYALFTYSWRLLSPSAQETLAQCAVFAGGFMVAAATAVIGTTEAELMGLVHQSLLTRGGNGRFQFHPLLHQFSKEKLGAMGNSEETISIARHYTHYLGWLHANKDTLMALPRHDLEVEFNNVALAWQSATVVNDFIYLTAVMEGWISYMLALTFKREGLRMIADTLEKFEKTAVSQTAETHGWLLAGYSFAQYGVANFEEMAAAADKLIALAPTPTLLVYGRYLKGAWARSAGKEIETGIEHLRYTAEHADCLVLPARLGALSELSIMLSWQGEIDEAMAHIKDALAIAKAHELTYAVTVLLMNIGIFYQEQKNYCQAITSYEEVYELTYMEADAPNALTLFERWASAYLELGQYDKATIYLEKSRSLSDGWLSWIGQVNSLNTHAHASIRMEQYQDGLQYAESSINLIVENQSGVSPLLMATQSLYGQAQLGLRQWESAGETFATALEGAEQMNSLEKAADLLAGLAAVGLAQDDLIAIRKWGDQLAEILPTISIYHDLVVEWVWIYLTCYQALTAVNDPRTADILQTAHGLLMEQAEMIEETASSAGSVQAVRQQFLNIPTHREIMRLMGEG